MPTHLPKPPPPPPTRPAGGHNAVLAPPPPPPPPPATGGPKSSPRGKLHSDGVYDDGTFGPGNIYASNDKSGAPMQFTSEVILEKLAAYLAFCDANPLVFGKEKRPLIPNLSRFFEHSGIQSMTFYKIEKDPRRYPAIQQVRESLRARQIEGGAAGFFQATIATRLAGLTDKSEQVVHTPAPAPQVNPLDVPNCIHPDDPDPLAPDRLLFSQRQIDAGVPYPMKVIPND